MPNHLKHAREVAGLSQNDLAEAIGTTPSTISDWERGEHLPSPYFRAKLSSVLQMSIVDLGLLPSLAMVPISDPFTPLPHTLVGREQQLIQLRQCVLTSRTTVLFGLPGVGKTALATILAYDQKIRKQFSDLLWMELGPNPNVAAQFLRWGKLLGLSPEELTNPNIEARIGMLRSAIRDRSLLFVIDDVWKIADALFCQIGGPNCGYLITTRFPDIAVSNLGRSIRIEELDRESGIALMRQIAPQVVAQEDAAIRELVELIGGLPLALTLMGKYLRVQAHSGQTRRIRTALARMRDGQERLLLHEGKLSLQATLASSARLLSVEAQRGLALLATTFPTKPQTFSEKAVTEKTAIPGEMLDALVDIGLVECQEDQYMLHPIISDYARFCLLQEERNS